MFNNKLIVLLSILAISGLANADITSGLVAYYPFNGNANDASGNGNDGVVYGATLVSDQYAKPNRAYSFDGINDYIYFGQILPDMTEMSISFYVKTGTDNVDSVIFGDADWELGNDITLSIPSNSFIEIRSDKNGYNLNDILDVGTNLFNSWHHIVWIMTAIESQIYIDGTLKTTINKGGSNVGYHNFILGTLEFPQGSIGWFGYWQGTLTNFRIYNRALSAVDIQELYQGDTSKQLTITKQGTGTGAVTSNPAGINCGTDCSENYTPNTAVTLTATAVGSNFAGFSGDTDCIDGIVTMNANKSCITTFNLASTAPTVVTYAANNIAATSATLNGNVNSNGASASVSFDFGANTTYGVNFAATPSSVYGNVAVTATKTGLSCNTIYHYRTKATNSYGTNWGADKSFTTVACPIPTHTVTATAGSGGKVNPSIATVTSGAKANFTVTANSGYARSNTVTGTCPQGSWSGNVWTTGVIIANCSANFSFSLTPVNAWLNPPSQTVIRNRPFTLNVIINSNSLEVGAYSFVVTLDIAKLGLDTTYQNANNTCIKGICPGANALSDRAAIVNATGSNITLMGSDNAGVGPSNDLQLLVLHFKAKLITGATQVTLTTGTLDTPEGGNIGLSARGATVNVSYGICGDSDGNLQVNIVDALAIARKLVGLPPPPTVDVTLADVDKSGTLSIADAMYVARYSVRLVIPPEVCVIGQPL